VSEPRIGERVRAGCAVGRYVGWNQAIYRLRNGVRVCAPVERHYASNCSGGVFWKEASDSEVWAAYHKGGRWA